MDNHHCKKCGKKRKEKEELDIRKTQPIGDDSSSSHQNHNHIVGKKHLSPDSHTTGAILARVDENTVIDGKIFFNVGISNNRSFRVTEDGSEFIFTKDGFYRLLFRGKMSCTGNIIFDRKPSVKRRQRQFSEARFGGAINEVSTMLPFQKGYRLSVRFECPDPGICVLEAGGQIEIDRVDDL